MSTETTEAYQEVLNGVLNQVEHLSTDERLKLLEDLMVAIHRQIMSRPKPKHSVTEFRGMAKKLWEGVDVEKYINEERNSWDG